MPSSCCSHLKRPSNLDSRVPQQELPLHVLSLLQTWQPSSSTRPPAALFLGAACLLGGSCPTCPRPGPPQAAAGLPKWWGAGPPSDRAGDPEGGRAGPLQGWRDPRPRRLRPPPPSPLTVSRGETGPELAGLGEAGLPTRTSASGGARTMTGQEVPRDGLPAPQVARPASLGTAEVLSSRWVSTIAPAGAGSQSAHRGSAGRPRPWASGRGHPQAGQGQLGEASTQEPEATKHSSAKSPDNFAPNVLFGKYQTAQKNWKVQ